MSYQCNMYIYSFTSFKKKAVSNQFVSQDVNLHCLILKSYVASCFFFSSSSLSSLPDLSCQLTIAAVQRQNFMISSGLSSAGLQPPDADLVLMPELLPDTVECRNLCQTKRQTIFQIECKTMINYMPDRTPDYIHAR